MHTLTANGFVHVASQHSTTLFILAELLAVVYLLGPRPRQIFEAIHVCKHASEEVLRLRVIPGILVHFACGDDPIDA